MIRALIEKIMTKLFDDNLFGEKLDITEDDIKDDLDFKGGHHTER